VVHIYACASLINGGFPHLISSSVKTELVSHLIDNLNKNMAEYQAHTKKPNPILFNDWNNEEIKLYGIHDF